MLAVITLLAAAAGGAPMTDDGAAGRVLDGVEIAQMSFRETVVIRVPLAPPPPPPTARLRPQLRDGPKCLPMNEMAGAAFSTNDAVDLIMRNGARYRAELENDCQSMEFYSGFYLDRTRDGRICSGRDTFRSRVGGQCSITRLRSLVPPR